MSNFPPLKYLIPVSLMVPLGAGAIAWANGFDGLYGQDSFAYFDYGANSMRQQLYPPLPFFWPPGYPLAIFLMSFIFGENPIGGQLISLLCGGLTALATGMIAHETWQGNYRRAVALLATGTIAVAGQLWQSSAVLMADTLSLAAATMGIWALARYARLLQSRSDVSLWLAIASASVACATITRWIYGVVAIVCVVYAFTLFWRHRAVAVRHGAFAAVAALAILLPVLLPSFTGSETFGGNFGLQFKNWHIAHAFQREFSNPDGQFSFAEFNALYYGRLPARTFYLTPILAAFAIPGFFAILRPARIAPFLPVFGWLLVVYGLLIGLPQQNVRFALSYLPPVAVLSAVGMVTVFIWLRRFRMLQVALVCLITGGMGWALYSGYSYTQSFITRQQHDLQTVFWLEEQIPDDAQIITFGLTLSIDHYTSIEPYEIYFLTPPDVREIIRADAPTYVLLDVYNVERQWVGKTPHTNYHTLLQNPGLTEIARYRAFTLFEVNRP